MEQLLICLSAALIAGLLMSRLAKAIHLPAVTSYLLAGLLLGPFFLGRLGLSNFGIGFGTLDQVDSLSIITQVALGFIAFVIGNEFRLSALESMGKQAITVGILQAVMTTALVDAALVILHFIRPDIISMASAITLAGSSFPPKRSINIDSWFINSMPESATTPHPNGAARETRM